MTRSLSIGILIVTGSIGYGQPVLSQVVSDNTLQTAVTQPIANRFEINNGVRSGNNLFHSFSQFSVPTNGAAIFNNALDIQNIFSRITGSQISNIDGIVTNQGNASLFLMNPNGIVFGPNAQLQLGGSFLGTTASSLQFPDGIEFNTGNITPALLSVNLPIGLQMGSNSGAIVVNGRGHALSNQSSVTGITGTQGASILKVNAGKNLALVSGNLTLNGGVLTTLGGGVYLGAIGNGLQSVLGLNLQSNLWQFDENGVANLGSLQLLNRSLVEVSAAVQPGNIQLAGANVDLRGGSMALIQNQGASQSGKIVVNARDRLTVQGLSTLPRLAFSALATYTNGSGAAGDILVNAREIWVQDRAEIRSTTRNRGSAGDILLKSASSIQLNNAFINPNGTVQGLSTIANTTTREGNAGTLTLVTPSLQLLPGSSISGTTLGSGKGGAINLMTESIELLGTTPQAVGSSTITVSAGGSGDAGTLNIETQTLSIQGGGSVRANSFLSGKGGEIVIRAAKSIEVVGESINPATGQQLFGSQINSGTSTLFSPNPTGSSGRILIQTPQLSIAQKGEVSIANLGMGDSEMIQIDAQQVFLRDQGKILAATRSGKGGNIGMNISEALVLRNGSQISTTAGDSGNGGNIQLNAPMIVGLENSDITANAVKGRGGSITIRTQSLLGLKYRDRRTPDNDITASSDFGINGTVQVNTIGINPANALNALPVEVIDSSRQIADRCGAAKTSSFIVTGRGGVPQDPTRKRSESRVWNDLRGMSSNPLSSIQVSMPQPNTESLMEANSLQMDESGSIALVASQPIALDTVATCGFAE